MLHIKYLRKRNILVNDLVLNANLRYSRLYRGKRLRLKSIELSIDVRYTRDVSRMQSDLL